MQKLLSAIATASILIAGLSFSAPAEAGSCVRIGGAGIGITEGIARWMANKATVDSAKKWAGTSRVHLSPVRISCSGLTCHGVTRACR